MLRRVNHDDDLAGIHLCSKAVTKEAAHRAASFCFDCPPYLREMRRDWVKNFSADSFVHKA